mmetsp:Transcript_52618/g.58834  ORF Transcript_52618/g.58834 Transcript_52618/m.58834 type:complete len:210 (+) Transcript_52618:238-867(+)
MIAIQTTNQYESEKCYISPTKKQKKRQRVVHFSPTVHIKHTISINDMTDEEIANTWIQHDEGDEIRQQCQALIAVVERILLVAGTTTDNVRATNQVIGCSNMRGLEPHTKHGKKRTTMNRYISKMIVLEEQDRQYYSEDRLDEEKIASIYKKVCFESQIHAEFMAKQDRRDVERYYKINKSTATTTTSNTAIHSSMDRATITKTIASAA